jgi:catechol 2,3-dioxygenase-like lactoylglutathione lyase family enzyme
MLRPIDHLVLAVRDLDAARATFQRLGFTLTPVARHPFGTANSLAQLGGSFLEILAVADETAIPPGDGTHFSFGAFNRDYLADGEGLSMLVLKSTDPAADRADFERHDLRVYEPFGFERTARGPGGTERKVAFSLTFTSDARLKRAGFFTCRHHHPENFWRAEYQRHPNGALAIASAVMVTRDPADFHEFFTHLTGQHEMTATTLDVSFRLGDGSRIEIMSPVGFKAFFGEEAAPDPRRFLGWRLRVADLAVVATLLTQNRVPFSRHAGALVVPSSAAHGAALAFETEA